MQYFGTDGIRGREEIFDDALLQKTAYAVFAMAKNPRILLARDTRVSGTRILKTLSAYLAAYGADVIDAGLAPTPVAAVLTRTLACDAGVMVSASHNPPAYNGIKVFSREGGKLSEAEEAALERAMDEAVPPAGKGGQVRQVDGEALYTAYLDVLLKPDLTGMKVLLDTANGACAKIAPAVFKKFGADVSVIYNETDGVRINENCGATVIRTLQQAMQGGGYDIGFSYDGDGDRLIAVKNGKVLDGDHILYIAARYMAKRGTLEPPVAVGTVMTNLGAEKAFLEKGIRLVRTAVGDKYVVDEMRREGYKLGGETSGHLIFSDYQTTGDGILSSLLLSVIDRETDIETLDDIQEYPQVMRDILTTPEAVKRFKADTEIPAYMQQIENGLDGRLVVRASGTEPKIRIMAEAADKNEGTQAADALRAFIKERIE